MYESTCSTKYVHKGEDEDGADFVADTSCSKLPLEICGAGCTYEDGEEECHVKTVTTVISVPEEVCDLNPQKTCRLSTKLVPKLEPVRECTTVPKETCRMVFKAPEVVKKPLTTIWCLDQGPRQDILETEKTSSGFLSSARKANISTLEIENGVNAVDTDLEEIIPPISLKSATESGNMNDLTFIEIESKDLNNNEITLENEFIQHWDYEVDSENPDNILDYDYNGTPSESQTSPIITVGLAATRAPPLNMRHRQMKNIVLERRLSVPPRAQNFRSTFPVDTSFLQVPRRDSTQGLDPRIGLPSLQFLRVKKSGYHSIDNSIGPKIPTNGLRSQLDFQQNRFQTRF